MALTAAQIAQTYRIIGVPQDGNLTIIRSIQGSWYDVPVPSTTNLSTITTMIDARLAALSASNLAQMVTLLAREAAIQTSVVKTGGFNERTSDHERERATIKTQIEDIIGIRITARQNNNRIER